jgi:hypothetical protein
METEDLLPPEVAAEAARRYLTTMCDVAEGEAQRVSADVLLEVWTSGRALFDAVVAVVVERFGEGAHVDKVGFSRHVVDLLRERVTRGEVKGVPREAMDILKRNCEVAKLQRGAERDSSRERISHRVERAVKAFERDHATAASRDDALVLLEEIDGVLDDTLEGDEVRLQLQKLRRDHDLNGPKAGALAEDGLRRVRYSAVNATQVSPGPPPERAGEGTGAVPEGAPVSVGQAPDSSNTSQMPHVAQESTRDAS